MQFINVLLANRSPMRVAERGPGRMTYAKKKKPFAEHDLRVTPHCAGNKARFYYEEAQLSSEEAQRLKSGFHMDKLFFTHPTRMVDSWSRVAESGLVIRRKYQLKGGQS